MLAAPNAAFGAATRPMPRRPEILADWIELWALAEDDSISWPMVADRLLEEEFVTDSDHAYRDVETAWYQLESRARSVADGYPLVVSEERIQPKLEPWEAPVYGFLLAASACEFFSDVRFPHDSPHRELFELVTVAAVSSALPEWEVLWCGAGSDDLKAAGGIVGFVGGKLRTVLVDPTYFARAKDGGVDFLAIWKGPDQRDGRPALWGQCASGITDWEKKTQQPNFDRWSMAIRISTRPIRAFAVPWALDEQKFKITVADSAGWVLDRIRIAAAGGSLRAGKVADAARLWAQEVIARLPRTD